MKPINKNQYQTTVINSEKNLFVITKKIKPSIIDVICPFVKMQNNNTIMYQTLFTVSNNNVSRIQSLYNIMPEISSYNSNQQNKITFDCTSALPIELFENADSGFIHFNMEVQKDKDPTVLPKVFIEPKAIYENIESTEIMIDSTNLKIDDPQAIVGKFPLHVSSFILNQGFIISIIDKNEIVLYVSINDINTGEIGKCLSKDIHQLITYIIPLWSMFSIYITKNSNKIFMINSFLNQCKQKMNLVSNGVLLKFSYSLKNKNVIKLQHYGNLIEPK